MIGAASSFSASIAQAKAQEEYARYMLQAQQDSRAAMFGRMDRSAFTNVRYDFPRFQIMKAIHGDNFAGFDEHGRPIICRKTTIPQVGR